MSRTPRPPFLRAVELAREVPSGFPFDLPAVAALDRLRLASVTLLAGDNGSGKSTIVEAIAQAAGFNPEGGGRNLRFRTHATESELHRHLRLRWRVQPRWGWFLRAETFFGMASHIARDAELQRGFGDLHGVSHGESFLDLILDRCAPAGFYVMDEPESALSIQGQMVLVRAMHEGIRAGAQFVVATHSPFLLAYPGAALHLLDDEGLREVGFDDLASIALWRRFFADPAALYGPLLDDEG